MIFFFILNLLIMINQPGGFEIIFSGPAPSDHFYTDHLDNIYFVDGHNIIKVETTSGENYEYGSPSAGGITAADVSNPLQIMIFYRDFNRIVFLGSKLSPLQPALDLLQLGIEQAVTTCSSGRGGFWVFSDRDNRLIYFDGQLRKTNQSKIISSITGSVVKPVFMIEAQNRLFLHVPREGILVFDRFASHVKTIPYDGPERFQVLGGNIVYFSEGELFGINVETLETKNYELPALTVADNIIMHHKRLAVLSGRRIKLFSFR
jgi:hypothetical protein